MITAETLRSCTHVSGCYDYIGAFRAFHGRQTVTHALPCVTSCLLHVQCPFRPCGVLLYLAQKK